jgi:hypothetical protein
VDRRAKLKELDLSVKVAKAFGLVISPSLLLRADEVIQ